METVDYVITTWGVDGPSLRQVRHAVFVTEQQVPEYEEWDELDPLCVHVLATLNREPANREHAEHGAPCFYKHGA